MMMMMDVELPYPGKKQQLAWQAARAHREHNMPAVLLYFSITNATWLHEGRYTTSKSSSGAWGRKGGAPPPAS